MAIQTRDQLRTYWNNNISANGAQSITGDIMNTGGIDIIDSYVHIDDPKEGMETVIMTNDIGWTVSDTTTNQRQVWIPSGGSGDETVTFDWGYEDGPLYVELYNLDTNNRNLNIDIGPTLTEHISNGTLLRPKGWARVIKPDNSNSHIIIEVFNEDKLKDEIWTSTNAYTSGHLLQNKRLIWSVNTTSDGAISISRSSIKEYPFYLEVFNANNNTTTSAGSFVLLDSGSTLYAGDVEIKPGGRGSIFIPDSSSKSVTHVTNPETLLTEAEGNCFYFSNDYDLATSATWFAGNSFSFTVERNTRIEQGSLNLDLPSHFNRVYVRFSFIIKIAWDTGNPNNTFYAYPAIWNGSSYNNLDDYTIAIYLNDQQQAYTATITGSAITDYNDEIRLKVYS